MYVAYYLFMAQKKKFRGFSTISFFQFQPRCHSLIAYDQVRDYKIAMLSHLPIPFVTQVQRDTIILIPNSLINKKGIKVFVVEMSQHDLLFPHHLEKSYKKEKHSCCTARIMTKVIRKLKGFSSLYFALNDWFHCITICSLDNCWAPYLLRLKAFNVPRVSVCFYYFDWKSNR